MNEEAILEAMEEVDKDRLFEYLLCCDELNTLLEGIMEQDNENVQSMVTILFCKASAQKYIMATDIVFKKELNSMVGEV